MTKLPLALRDLQARLAPEYAARAMYLYAANDPPFAPTPERPPGLLPTLLMQLREPELPQDFWIALFHLYLASYPTTDHELLGALNTPRASWPEVPPSLRWVAGRDPGWAALVRRPPPKVSRAVPMRAYKMRFEEPQADWIDAEATRRGCNAQDVVRELVARAMP